MAKALVTGGGGFVGRHLVRQLIAAGEEVRVLGRREYRFLEEIGAECQRGDIGDADSVAVAAEGCDIIYHAAALPGVWGSDATFERINVQGTRNVIEACHQHAIGRLVFTSSPSVVFDGQDHIDADESLPYPDGYLCAYPRTKAAAERLVLAADDPDRLRTVSLRPHLVFGPEDGSLTPRVHQRARAGRLRIVGDGQNRISVAYVENVAAAHCQAAKELAADARCAGKAYFVNEPESVTTGEWINTLLAFGDLPPCDKRIPLSLAYTAGSFLETVWTLSFRKSEPPMTRFVALQLGRSHTYRIDAAQRDFNYTPVVNWNDAIQKTRDYYASDRDTPQAQSST